MIPLILASTLCLVAACAPVNTNMTLHDADKHNKELIVLAAPPDGDTYYAEIRQNIFDFHIAYAKQIAEQDNVLILSGDSAYGAYVAALGQEKVAKIEMQDIWMRDFSPSNAANPIMFRYTAEGQGGRRRGQSEADYVQDALATFIESTGITLVESDLLNDGGNFVDDYAGNAILSRKFLRDNGVSEQEARRLIRQTTGVQNIAFIEADEQGGLEHADGVAAFIAENTLVINAYPDNLEYAAELKADLKRGLPDVVIHEIITPYDGNRVYDTRFGSACGLYTNMLVTPSRIYLPQFGIEEDAIALESVRKWTDREVIPVQSGKVCQMGGGVRCMSWQARGPLAEGILNYIAKIQ